MIKKGIKTYNNIQLIDIHSAGRSIGKIGNRNVYVDNGIPGEILNIDIAKRQKNGGFILGKIQNINSSSFQRVMPFCKHFGKCGGCNWQHFNYEAQLEWKRTILINALSKYEVKTPVIPNLIPSPLKYYFRNKLEYAFSSNGWYEETESNKDDSIKFQVLGFHPINRPDQVLEIKECFLQSEQNNIICEEIKKFTLLNGYAYYNYIDKSGLLKSICFRTSISGDLMVIIGFAAENKRHRNDLLIFLQTRFPEITSLNYFIYNNEDKKRNNYEVVHFSGKKKLDENFEDFHFQISPMSFFQPNKAQAVNIYIKVKEFAQLGFKPKLERIVR